MNVKRLTFVFGTLLFASFSSLAQQKPGTLAALEFQTPKNGAVKQYEDGRKQKADWHKQQKDPLPLLVWETLTGDATGTYIVGRLEQHWADLDKPAVPDQADLDEFNKVLGSSVQSVVSRYYEFMPKVSNPPASTAISKFSEIITYHVRYGHGEDFDSAMARVNEAVQKTKWPVNYLWYQLVDGGAGGTYVLVIPHDSYADFEDKPEVKPFREMLKDAFGPSEAGSIVKRFDAAIDSETSSIIRFRPELSYLPK
jgi:hypothetical protein